MSDYGVFPRRWWCCCFASQRLGVEGWWWGGRCQREAALYSVFLLMVTETENPPIFPSLGPQNDVAEWQKRPIHHFFFLLWLWHFFLNASPAPNNTSIQFTAMQINTHHSEKLWIWTRTSSRWFVEFFKSFFFFSTTGLKVSHQSHKYILHLLGSLLLHVMLFIYVYVHKRILHTEIEGQREESEKREGEEKKERKINSWIYIGHNFG